MTHVTHPKVKGSQILENLTDHPAVTVEDLCSRATVTVAVAAAFLKISRNTAYSAAKAGETKALQLGRRIVVPTAPLLEMVGLGAVCGVPR